MCALAFVSPNATTQMRGQMESQMQELEHVRESLTAAERRLHECQESLQRCKGTCADQAHTVRQLQGQVSSGRSEFCWMCEGTLWTDFAT